MSGKIAYTTRSPPSLLVLPYLLNMDEMLQTALTLFANHRCKTESSSFNSANKENIGVSLKEIIIASKALPTVVLAFCLPCTIKKCALNLGAHC